MIQYVGEHCFSVDSMYEEVIVETDLMRSIRKKTFDAFDQGASIVSWAGPQGTGKTITAGWVKALIDRRLVWTGDPFAVKDYRIGKIPDGRNAHKDGVSSVASVCTRLVPHALSKWREERIVESLIHALQADNIQLIFVDDIDNLCEDAIEGLAFVVDSARKTGWRLTLVLIGIGSTMARLRQNGRIQRRVNEWCYFEPYDREGVHRILSALEPHFASLDLSRPSDLEQLDFIHGRFQGVPGDMVPFVKRVQRVSGELGHPIDMDLLKGAFLLTHEDRSRTLAPGVKGYPELVSYNDEIQGPADPPAEEEQVPPEAPKRQRTRRS